MIIQRPEDFARLVNIVLLVAMAFTLIIIIWRWWKQMETDQFFALWGLVIMMVGSAYGTVDVMIPGPPNPIRVWWLTSGLVISLPGMIHWALRLAPRVPQWRNTRTAAHHLRRVRKARTLRVTKEGEEE